PSGRLLLRYDGFSTGRLAEDEIQSSWICARPDPDPSGRSDFLPGGSRRANGFYSVLFMICFVVLASVGLYGLLSKNTFLISVHIGFLLCQILALFLICVLLVIEAARYHSWFVNELGKDGASYIPGFVALAIVALLCTMECIAFYAAVCELVRSWINEELSSPPIADAEKTQISISQVEVSVTSIECST
ncbi:hypothetical protein PENTCL1PPCAC_8238, partial [Pristionchus entomophagus]